MIKTKFVFAVSLVSLMAVNSTWAAVVTDSAPVNDANKAPISGTVGKLGDVYDWSAFDGYQTSGIAGVTYVNKAVDAAGNAAQWAENHAAAAGAAAISAADSAGAANAAAGDAADAAAAAAESAKNANDALDNKQDQLSQAQLDAADSGITSAKVSAYDTHVANGDIHVTAEQKTAWSAKQEALNPAQLAAANSGVTSDKVSAYDTHVANGDIHVTAEQKTAWNAKQGALTADQLAAANSGITAGKVSTYDGYANQIAGKQDKSNMKNDLEGVLDKTAVYPTVQLVDTLIADANNDLGGEIADALQAANSKLATVSSTGSGVVKSVVKDGTAVKATLGTIVDADIASNAAIAVSKINGLGSLATKSAVATADIENGAVTAAKTTGVMGKVPYGDQGATTYADFWVK